MTGNSKHNIDPMTVSWYYRCTYFLYSFKGGGEVLSVSRILKWVTGSFEAILGIPIIGAWIILSFAWTPLFAMLILHIITLVMTKRDNGASTGSVLGIITSCVGWIPFVGMVMHILSAIFLMINAATPDDQSVNKATI